MVEDVFVVVVIAVIAKEVVNSNAGYWYRQCVCREWSCCAGFFGAVVFVVVVALPFKLFTWANSATAFSKSLRGSTYLLVLALTGLPYL
jgi:hypothetical protein